MKTCAYCGKENQDAASACAECGTAEFQIAGTPSVAQPNASEAGSRWRELMNDRARIFKALVVASTAAYLVWFFQLIVGENLIRPAVWEALSWQGYGALVHFPAAFGWLQTLVWVAVAVGMYGFSKSARMVFTLFTAFSFFLTLLSGVQVQSAFGSFLCLLVNTADGAILALAYTSPLKERFK